jgi:quinoprotein glucose dehydrogenase
MIPFDVCQALRRAVFFVLAPLSMTPGGRLDAAETTEAFGAGGSAGAKVATASRDGELAIKKFRIAPGLQAELWAAEPLTANIVAFNFDDQGRCYVVETFRHSDGVTDIRSHMDWLDEELASKSVAERVAIMQRHEGAAISKYTRMTDRLRKVWDSTGSGRADQATVFSDGYNQIPDGLASGVLAWRGSVYFANIPHLWRLQDLDGDGKAEKRESLLDGFGVRVGFLGHDLHGLTVGPDGRLYFTIGDRGAHVVTRDGRTVSNPETGAFYRCNLDGTELEIVASGLRNPEEIAFDEFGNWFTGDNNSDGGDPARWVALVEGGNSGWHIGYQFIDRPNSRGPWIAERMCYPTGEGQPAYLIPPVATIASGPAGLAHDPGTGLPERYRHHFFLCDFTGGHGSGVHSFALKAKGAGWEMVDHDHLISEILATDVEVGPDGGVYVSDWVQGWDKTGKGRIYRIFDPALASDRLRLETRDLIAADLTRRPAAALASLLGHADQRVRLRAQFELAARGAAGEATLRETLRSARSPLLARVHAIWGLGQQFRQQTSPSKRREIAGLFLRALKDPDAELRGQAARALGEASWKEAAPALATLTTDPQPHTRFLAALALARLKIPTTSPVFVELARRNDAEGDPYLRHAAVMGLAGIADESALAGLGSDPSPEVRRVAIVALRRLSSPRVAVFLKDPRPDLVTEAARAISDLPIVAALPDLASMTGLPASTAPALWRRVLNANFRLGAQVNAAAAARLAATEAVPAAVRAEALQCLAQWAKPPGRDRVTGLWRPVDPRPADIASTAGIPVLPGLLAASPAEVQTEAARLAAQWNDRTSVGTLFALLEDKGKPLSVRRAALQSLASLKSDRLPAAIELAAADAAEDLRRDATGLQGQSGGSEALRRLSRTLEKGSRGEQQAAFAALATLKDPAVDPLLVGWLDRLIAGQVAPHVQLDLIEAAEKRNDDAVKERLKRIAGGRKSEDPIGAYRECLEGGDPEAGRKVFQERADVACVRCHKIRGEGGEVGPELTGILSRKPREYILESIVAPNRQIAAGFETVLVTLKDGTAVAGQLKKETDTDLDINSPEDGMVHVKKANITSRERGLSPMPEELRQMLSKQDLRNLVEFLSSVR